MSRPTKEKRTAGRRCVSGIANRWGVIDDAKHTPQMASARILAAVATHAACEQLDRYALATDAPDPRMVDAADLLDAARDALAGVQ